MSYSRGAIFRVSWSARFLPELPPDVIPMRTQAPRGATLVIAFVLWLIGALELVGHVAFPNHIGQWALLACGALLLLGCLLKGL
jgi:hypothetical protein